MNLMKRRRPRRPDRHDDPLRRRVWPNGWALVTCFAAGLVGVTGLTWLVLAWHDVVGALQFVFASVVGVGVVVALVIVYRRQRVVEATSMPDQTQVLNERFMAIGAQLGDDQAAVRLAGVGALADLADDWEENRQTCIDVMCGYLRMPYEPDPGDEADTAEQLKFRGSREVRHSVIMMIAEHLREGAAVSWQGMNFDFTGVVFDGGDFSGAVFSGGTISFGLAVFSGGTVRFNLAVFSGGTVRFDLAKFSGGAVYFGGAVFSDGAVYFDGAEFSDSTVRFDYAEFSGGAVHFDGAKFSGGAVRFVGAEFSGGAVRFMGAEFSGSALSFGQAWFSGGTVSFEAARLGGFAVDFSDVADWSCPPMFDWDGTPPPGVDLPAAGDVTSP